MCARSGQIVHTQGGACPLDFGLYRELPALIPSGAGGERAFRQPIRVGNL
jgi:hypothetical protein